MLEKGGEEPVRVPGGICHEGCEVVRAEGVGRGGEGCGVEGHRPSESGGGGRSRRRVGF